MDLHGQSSGCLIVGKFTPGCTGITMNGLNVTIPERRKNPSIAITIFQPSEDSLPISEPAFKKIYAKINDTIPTPIPIIITVFVPVMSVHSTNISPPTSDIANITNIPLNKAKNPPTI